jgi:NAD(P)-dependent dehydrogenase (short-subunit alcohol dehydrogenase family)
MKDFEGKLAVITGGGAGMGRELARELAGAGCHVAICDLRQEPLDETQRLCADANEDVTVSTHLCDVSDEASVESFRDAVMAAHETSHVNLVFANAGISGGGSFVLDERRDWDRTFGVCWFGVYYTARAFLPLLIAADEGHLVNTSSINGFWAAIGKGIPHTAYATAKFAVKGFTEALVTDLRLNAPHVGVSVVMPGHIGTDIALNSGMVIGRDSMTAPGEGGDPVKIRAMLERRGLPVGNLPDHQIQEIVRQMGEYFRTNAPMSAGEAATVILDGVREGRWRILVGEDAHELDQRVRAEPEEAYETDFLESLQEAGHFTGLRPPIKD